MVEQTIILERYAEKSWKAYFMSDRDTCGVGRSKSEAVASLYTNNIGKLILENPKRFGLRIEDPDVAAQEGHPVVYGKKGRRTKRIDIPLEPKDWDAICSALKNEFHVKVTELFRNNGNTPLTPRQINKQAGDFLSRFSEGMPESMHGVLRKAGLKFRLLPSEFRTRNLWEDDPLRFWVME